jgi:hypothetical protein
MKINEVMAKDKTRKDHNGNFLGFDPTRKVWVVIPRDVGKSMINKGELKDGALMMATRYPEFSPSTSPQLNQNPTANPAAPGALGYAVDKMKSNNPLSPSNIKQAGRNAVDKLARVPAAAGDWLDRDAQKQRSRGGDFTG